MKTLIVLVLGLGAALPSWAHTECIRSLESADSVLNRAASLESRIVEFCKRPVPSQVVQSCGDLNRKLARLLEAAAEKPRAAEIAMEKLMLETERLSEFLAAYLDSPSALATYLSSPQFLMEDASYLTKDGTAVQFSKSFLRELQQNDRLAPLVLRALDHGHLIRLTQDSSVVEVRVRAREFGNARAYGLVLDGGIWVDQIILNHMRAHDIPNVVRQLRKMKPAHSNR